MKKLFLTLCVVAVASLTFANPPKKNKSEKFFTYSANQSLMAIYGNVENVVWSQAMSNMLRADFIFEDEKLSAFFDSDGNHVATTVEVTMEKLPAVVRKSIKTKADGRPLLGLVQSVSDSNVNYYFKVADGNKNLVYKVTSTGIVTRFL